MSIANLFTQGQKIYDDVYINHLVVGQVNSASDPADINASVEIKANLPVLFSRMTTSDIYALSATDGMQVYNLSSDQFLFHQDSVWVPFNTNGPDSVSEALIQFYLTNNQTISINSNATLAPMTVQTYSYTWMNAAFDASSGIFTVPVAYDGLYKVSYKMDWLPHTGDADFDTVYCDVRKNGTFQGVARSARQGPISTTDQCEFTQSATTVLSLAASDTISFAMVNNSLITGHSIAVAQFTTGIIEYLGPASV